MDNTVAILFACFRVDTEGGTYLLDASLEHSDDIPLNVVVQYLLLDTWCVSIYCNTNMPYVRERIKELLELSSYSVMVSIPMGKLLAAEIGIDEVEV